MIMTLRSNLFSECSTTSVRAPSGAWRPTRMCQRLVATPDGAGPVRLAAKKMSRS